MAKNENRKKFLKNAGILGLAGLFGFSKMGNMPIVKAAINDNAEAKDISNDIIRCNTNDVFNSGETAAELADAVNGLNASFSSALTDLKNTDVAKAVGANGSKFPTVIGVLGTIKTYLSGAVSKSVQVGSSYKIPAGYHDGSSEITAVAKSGTNPTKITTNGTHSTGGYESVNVQVSSYKIVKYVAETTGAKAGGKVKVIRYNPDGSTNESTTYCNSNDSAGWPELSVWAWEHWQYQFSSKGTVYIDGKLKQNTNGNFAVYDSGNGATHTHTVEVILKA